MIFTIITSQRSTAEHKPPSKGFQCDRLPAACESLTFARSSVHVAGGHSRLLFLSQDFHLRTFLLLPAITTILFSLFVATERNCSFWARFALRLHAAHKLQVTIGKLNVTPVWTRARNPVLEITGKKYMKICKIKSLRS